MQFGGLSETKPATPEIQKIADKIKPQLEKKTNGTFEEFKAIEYKTQVVSGFNYFIKIQTGADCYVHVRVYSGIGRNEEYELHGYQLNKTKDDEITHS